MLGKGAGDRAGARIFQSPVNHRRDLRFDSKRHGKPFLTSEKHPCLSCSCDHCDSVSSYDWHQMMWPGQDPEVMVSGMRDILGIVPANAGRSQTGSVSLELREGSCGVLRALDIQLGLEKLWTLPLPQGLHFRVVKAQPDCSVIY